MAHFHIEGNALRISGDLLSDEEPMLRRLCRKLYSQQHNEIVVDLCDADEVAVPCLATLADCWLELLNDDRNLLTVVSPSAHRILSESGYSFVLSPTVCTT
jgi:ABC-type transporter Mla MlaB component